MDTLYVQVAPGLERANGRCKLLCLGQLLDDMELGGRVTLTWNLLSETCHHRVYELQPTLVELNHAFDVVWELADSVERVRAAMAR